MAKHPLVDEEEDIDWIITHSTKS